MVDCTFTTTHLGNGKRAFLFFSFLCLISVPCGLFQGLKIIFYGKQCFSEYTIFKGKLSLHENCVFHLFCPNGEISWLTIKR